MEFTKEKVQEERWKPWLEGKQGQAPSVINSASGPNPLSMSAMSPTIPEAAHGNDFPDRCLFSAPLFDLFKPMIWAFSPANPWDRKVFLSSGFIY